MDLRPVARLRAHQRRVPDLSQAANTGQYARPLHVAVGVIERAGTVLLSRRAASSHQGGLWEFPGGKVEAGESVRQALERELAEELDLRVLQARALLQVTHDYGDKAVLLDVWRVTAYSGEPRALEGQPLRWVDIAGLDRVAFPAANLPIVRALQG